MPEPPFVNPFTRYVLENPWPLGVVLLAIAAALAWTACREGLTGRLRGAAVIGSVGAAVLVAGWMVETPGEKARAVVRQFVSSVVAKDIIAADAMLTDGAVMAVGSPKNPGFGIDVIRDLLDRSRKYSIESNTITMLRGYGEESGKGVVHMACYTTVDGFQNMSQWVMQVQKQGDGVWRISHLTCVTVNGQPPQLGRW